MAAIDGSKQSDQPIECVEELLPGIPDDITITEIATKLPWKAFHTLSAVSCGWRRAIQSHQVYAARVRSKRTQTLLAFKHGIENDDRATIVLYCIEDDSWHHLPPIPGLKAGLPSDCECIFLDGKVYILGGLKNGTRFGNSTAEASAEVYMFDVAGQREWKMCAKMEHPREMFGCGAKDGKIYVFGGMGEGFEPICGSEVYDPNKDAWSPIKPMPNLGFDQGVAVVGEELFVHSGQFFERTHTQVTDFFERYGDDPLSDLIQNSVSAEVYHPDKNEWRTVECFIQDGSDSVMVVGGILHKLNRFGIQIYDSRADSWKPKMQEFSFSGLNSRAPSRFHAKDVITAVAVDDEIIALASLQVGHRVFEKCVIKSQGVCGENKEILWHKLPFAVALGNVASHFSPIHL